MRRPPEPRRRASISRRSGTLNWANGDGAAKTFAVPIIDDALVDPNETITLTLSNATGGAVPVRMRR